MVVVGGVGLGGGGGAKGVGAPPSLHALSRSP